METRLHLLLKVIKCLGAAVVLTFTLALIGLPATTDSLESVLARLDRVGASFSAVSADVTWAQHTAVINEDLVDTGTMRLKRTKRDIRMLINLTAPDAKTVALQGHKLEVYYPKMQTVQEYDTGKYQTLLEQFLLLGFGTTGKELAAAYRVSLLGADTIAGQKSTGLQLVPKSEEILKNLKRVDLWISDSGDYPVQQKLYLQAGDYRLVTYTNVKMNPPLADADLKLKLPKNVERVFPQK